MNIIHEICKNRIEYFSAFLTACAWYCNIHCERSNLQFTELNFQTTQQTDTQEYIFCIFVQFKWSWTMHLSAIKPSTFLFDVMWLIDIHQTTHNYYIQSPMLLWLLLLFFILIIILIIIIMNGTGKVYEYSNILPGCSDWNVTSCLPY